MSENGGFWSKEARDRLQLAVTRFGTRDAVAERAGVPKPTLEKTLSGASEPKISTIAAIANALSISIDYLLTGSGAGGEGRAGVLNADFERVPIVGVVAGAGEGQAPITEEVTGYVLFPRSFLRRLADPSKLQLIPIRGDSMVPELRDGDLAMVDVSRIDRAEGLLVMSLEGELVAKRLRLKGGRKVELISSHPEYPPIEVDLAKQELSIKGKVVWTGRFQ